MKTNLKIFNSICDNLLNEQTTAEVSAKLDGKDMKVKTSKKDENTTEVKLEGNIQLQQQEIPNTNIEQNIQHSSQISELINDLTLKLELAKQTNRSAKDYLKRAITNKENVIYDCGYSEGQKQILKYILQKLQQIQILGDKI